jgi:lysophospholipase L1-like esterase
VSPPKGHLHGTHDLVRALLGFAQALLAACAIILAIWGRVPFAVAVGLTLVVFAVAIAQAPWLPPRVGSASWCLRVTWLGTALASAGELMTSRAWDTYYGAWGWLVAGFVLLTHDRTDEESATKRWRGPAMVWAVCGSWIWLAGCYLQNQRGAFYVGLTVLLVQLILCLLWFRLGAVGVVAVNTLLLLVVVLPLSDLVIRWLSVKASDPHNGYYTFEIGSRHSIANERWNHACHDQYGILSRAIFMPDPKRILPFVLRPASRVLYFENSITINHQGFRGREIPEDKGRTYRIVALGESTTFGLGVTADDVPWPELLEQIIQDRLKLPRPVEVINAGVPAYDLKNNLARFATDILPLKPDMIISYHGLNGFHLISESLPRAFAKNQPVLKERPIKVLGEAEYGFKIFLFNQRQKAELAGIPPLTDPMQTEYAAAYRQLIDLAATNRIRLVLANYSMAINSSSGPRVIDFYRRTTPLIDWQIKANEIHTMILERLAQENPGIHLVDTHPRLDGEYRKFTDPVHFTTEGDRQMVETFFAGISKLLESDMATAETAAKNTGTGRVRKAGE